VQRIDGAFFAGAEFPFIIIDRVAHHGPRHGGIDTQTEGEEELADDIDDQIQSGVIGCDNEQAQTGYDGNDGAEGGQFFFAELGNGVTGQRGKHHNGDHGKELDDTRDLHVLKIGLEDDGNGGGSALHTDEHTHGGNGGADSRTVFQEVAECLEDIELGHFFADFRSGIDADLGIADHELEAEEAEDAHDESGNKDAFADEVIILVIDEERQDDHREHIAEDGADGAPSRKGGSVLDVVRNEGEQRAVGHVGDGIESVPYDIAGDEDDELGPDRSVGERQEAAGAANDEPDGAGKYVGQEFVAFIGATVGVDNRADEGVVDRIPHLNDDEKKRVPQVHTHKLCPEDGHGAFECKTHVASKVTGGIGDAVANAKLAMPGSIDFGCFFHSVNSLK